MFNFKEKEWILNYGYNWGLDIMFVRVSFLDIENFGFYLIFFDFKYFSDWF